MALHNRLLIALVLVCITHVTYGALELPSSSNINSESPLRVCIQDRPPMAMCSSANTTGYTGFSVELFRVAAGLILSNGSSLTENKQYKFVCVNKTTPEVMTELTRSKDNRTCDAAISAITISIERQQMGVKFAYPYYKSSVAILTQASEASQDGWAWTQPFSTDLWIALAVTIVIYPFLVAFLELTTTKRVVFDKETALHTFPRQGGEAVYNSLWTMLQGHTWGEGSTTIPARAATLCFAFFALIVVSSYTANLAAFLTVSKINTSVETVSDLRGKAIATVPVYIPRLRTLYGLVPSVAQISQYSDILDYADMVAKGELTAFLYDEPMARTAAASFPGCSVRMLQDTVLPFDFGAAFASDTLDSTVAPFSAAILQMWENGDITTLRDNFITSAGAACTDYSTVSESTPEITFMNLYGLWLILIGGVTLGFLFMLLVRRWKRKQWEKEASAMMHLNTNGDTRGRDQFTNGVSDDTDVDTSVNGGLDYRMPSGKMGSHPVQGEFSV